MLVNYVRTSLITTKKLTDMVVRAPVILIIGLDIVLQGICYEEKTQDVHVYEGTDFQEVVKTTLFVDKTMLIKRFYDSTKHGSGILVLAPRHYGKTTNMDMIKRFYTINVEESGVRKKVEETQNYSLFKDNFLNIYKVKPFFAKHFGKHPVVSIDYSPLEKVKTVEEMLGVFFVQIMMESFLQHKYLLNDQFLWTLNETYSWIDKDRFLLYLSPEKSYKLTETDIQTGFSFLVRLLRKRFEELVIVLVDNYDSFVDSPLYSQNPKIFHLIGAVNNDLLRCEGVERSLVTGIIRPSGPTVDRGEVLPSCVAENDCVWPYYGLSGQELEYLLQPIVQDDEEREKVIGKIVHNYSGYSVATFEVGDNQSGQLLDTQSCSVWSVMEYLKKELAVENFSSLV